MNITSARYTFDGTIIALIDGVEMFVPDDMSNIHRIKIEESGIYIEPYISAVIELETLKKTLKHVIDSLAENERLKYITSGSGQSMTYQSKLSEANRFIESGGVGEYPFLSAEIGITGDTLQDVASVIINMNRQWVLIGSEIERIRLDAKKKIDSATTEEEANSYVPNFSELLS